MAWAAATWPDDRVRRAKPTNDGMKTQSAIVVLDWEAQAFLCAGGTGRTARTAWCFLSELESSGVPSNVADYVRETTRSALETRVEADAQLRSGHLSIYKEMIDACEAMEAGRSQLMARFLVSTPRGHALREAWRASQQQTRRAPRAGAGAWRQWCGQRIFPGSL